MSDLKSHNPLAIGLAKIPPDFINPEGVKWWGLDIGAPEDGKAVYVEFPTGARTYAILKDNEIVYDTHSLEFLCGKFEQLKLIRTMT